MSEKKRIGILGSTGSIGCNALDLIAHHPEKFSLEYITAGKNCDLLIAQALTHRPKHVVIQDETQFQKLKEALAPYDIKVHAGNEMIVAITSHEVDLTVAAIVGVAGLRPMINALKYSQAVAIANKEPLVAAGDLVMACAKKYNAKILPIDSEHNAIFQVFEEHNRASIARLVLTASGGPFRVWTKDHIQNATREDALNHPNWKMGPKITIDSATLVNKALELIEAHYLFQMPHDKIDVVIHPQSIIHSLVEYEDGSYLAQMGAADMRTPLAYALAWPQRMQTSGQRLDLLRMPTLSFEDVDHEKFPSLNLARECLKAGQGACITFNAANEVAVDAFLKGKITFPMISHLIEKALQNQNLMQVSDLDAILEYDKTVRTQVQTYIM